MTHPPKPTDETRPLSQENEGPAEPKAPASTPRQPGKVYGATPAAPRPWSSRIWVKAPPAECPECGTPNCLTPVGPGVERIKDEAAELFPEARLSVLSSDITVGAAAGAVADVGGGGGARRPDRVRRARHGGDHAPERDIASACSRHHARSHALLGRAAA